MRANRLFLNIFQIDGPSKPTVKLIKRPAISNEPNASEARKSFKKLEAPELIHSSQAKLCKMNIGSNVCVLKKMVLIPELKYKKMIDQIKELNELKCSIAKQNIMKSTKNSQK